MVLRLIVVRFRNWTAAVSKRSICPMVILLLAVIAILYCLLLTNFSSLEEADGGYFQVDTTMRVQVLIVYFSAITNIMKDKTITGMWVYLL